MSNDTDSTKDRLSTPDWAQIPKKKGTQKSNNTKRSLWQKIKDAIATLFFVVFVLFVLLMIVGTAIGTVSWLITTLPPMLAPTPTITIETILTTDAGEEWNWQNAGKEFKRRWRINTSRRARKDFVVLVSQAHEDSGGSIQVFWVLIPESSRHSEAFAFDYNIKVEIHPLPMASIVGKGKVVDLDKLQRGLPVETFGGHRITEDFDFPLYKVGEPSSISERFAP